MRRDYCLTAVGIISITALNLPVVIALALAQGPIDPKNESEFTQLQEIAAKFEIEIATSKLGFPIKTIHGLIEGREAERETLGKYQKLLAAEVNRYPKSLIQNSKLMRIVLCEQLYFDGQRRNAIPDFEHNVLYLDVKRGDYNHQYQRKVIHHEFFHLIDYKDDGSVYADNEWAALNPDSFHYGSGGRNAQDDASTSVLTDRYPGFLNHYSTTGVEEDKAEVFANMVVVPKHVETRSSEDPVIKSKANAMKSLIQKFCPEINEDFWKHLTK